MASVSVSHLIIFIASLVVAAGVAGTLTTGVERVSSSIEDGSIDTSQQVRTDVEIISDPQATYSEPVTIHVRNTGSQNIPIDPGSVNVIFNGEFVPNSDISIEDANDASNTVWRNGDVVNVTISNVALETDNRIFLTVNGDREELEFTN
ncbi:flagellar protein G [Halonotius terrestris]|uniref:Flagellar protein G n=1 Tax=Halonotius terrestris TaxID=2487750 RepID=A0A8J8P952_9EURY|nr:flagellar protein G [Halonotius terrestris]TQQ81026.1 flagellar protein G [Halonotius terrestris]